MVGLKIDDTMREELLKDKVYVDSKHSLKSRIVLDKMVEIYHSNKLLKFNTTCH